SAMEPLHYAQPERHMQTTVKAEGGRKIRWYPPAARVYPIDYACKLELGAMSAYKHLQNIRFFTSGGGRKADRRLGDSPLPQRWVRQPSRITLAMLLAIAGLPASCGRLGKAPQGADALIQSSRDTYTSPAGQTISEKQLEMYVAVRKRELQIA